ncbi:RNA polymerase sigma-70 factor (ECF subfamily) [Arthrobacter sp. CAN_A212]|uniref:RNA polymerase sigma factor n=1 Tax=Arthrobacter sp. CAN_A212 TaxID=2787719 RepID=UPI001A322A20
MTPVHQPHASKLAGAADAVLVERSIDGDPEAFEVMIRRYAKMMRAYAARLLGGYGADADDVVQEALVAAWKRMEDVRQSTSIKSWLMSIVGHKAVDLIRRRKPDESIGDHHHPGSPSDDVAGQVENRSAADALSLVLETLPEDQRQCWTLREIGEMSYAQIAAELSVSESTVRGRLTRARSTLVKEMEAWR